MSEPVAKNVYATVSDCALVFTSAQVTLIYQFTLKTSGDIAHRMR
jgi:hypothetical protein